MPRSIPLLNANRRNARLEPAVLLGRVLPAQDRGGREVLFETVEVLRKLEPHFFSVTYGAGGATREGTLETTRAIRDEYGSEAMAHLSCVGETAESLREIIDRIADAGIENILALRGDPPRGEKDFEPPEGGLGSSAELAALIRETHPDIAIGGPASPRSIPRRRAWRPISRI